MGSVFKYLFTYNRVMKALTGNQSVSEVNAGTTPVKGITGVLPEHDCLEHLELGHHWYKWRCKVCDMYWDICRCQACGTDMPYRVDLPTPDYCSSECAYDHKHCGVRP